MGHKDWRDKFRELIRSATGRKPVIVEPRHRWSGPVETPSDWFDPDRQQFLGPQCTAAGCHQNIPKGTELVDGLWCAACAARYSVTRRRAMGGGDLPPAA